jgi:sec-independent protein translocase protein TatB
MEFLGIGYQELLLVLGLLLVVVGPERLPGMAYQLGKTVRTMQKYARAVRDEFKDEFDYVEEQVKVVRGEIDTAKVTMREQQQAFNSEMRALDNELKVELPPLLPSSDSSAPAPAPVTSETVPAHSSPPPSSGNPPLVF